VRSFLRSGMTFRLMEPAGNSEIRLIILRGESDEERHIRELDVTRIPW
jgi:hypothetical protein